MSTLSNVLIIIHSIMCIALVIIILLQAGRGGGMSPIFGEIFSPLTSSSTIEKNLNRITIAVSIVFAITTILLYILL